MAAVTAGLPAIDYTSKDYAGFMASILSYAKTAFPEWTNQNPGSLEMMILESLARELDVLSYYGDRIVAESYIGTATQLSSVIQLAALLGYSPGQPLAATGTVTFQTATSSPAVIVPAATQVTTNFIANLNGPIVFETQAIATVPANGGTVVVNVAQGVTQGNSVFTVGNNTNTPSNVTVEFLGTSDGSDYQTFALLNNPVVSDSITIYVENPTYSTLLGTDPIVPWVEINSLTSSSSTDLTWAKSVDANGVVTIHFGDNINGSVPASGLSIYANYRVGGGIIGNLSANQITDIASAITGIAITGSSATTGGTDAENIDQIRTNAPRAYTTQQRAITLNDYANLALSISSVSQAKAVDYTFGNVRVYITGTGNTAPSAVLLDKVNDFLQERAAAGVVVTTQAASSAGINIGSSGNPVVVGFSPRYSPTAIKTMATQAIQNIFSPSNVVLGQRIPVSQVYSTLMAIPGVIYVSIPVMYRVFDTSSVNDIVLRDWEYPVISDLYISTNPVTT
jgi:hypothetical protein